MTTTAVSYTQAGADAKFRTAAQVTTAVNAAVAALVGAAPAALDTLVEIATQLQSDESGAAALSTLVGNVRNATDATFKEAIQDLVAAMFPGGTYDDPAGTITFAAGGGTGAVALGATALKTSSYTAAANDLVPVDCSAGNVTITLPTAPSDKTVVAVKLVAIASPYTVTIARGGTTDVFNKAGGNSSVSLTLVNQMMVFRYASAAGIWYVEDAISLASIQPVISGSTLDKFTAQIASGSATVVNNVVPGGILVDTATTVTKVYLHADTAPTGAALTVTATDSTGNLYFTQTIAAGATDQATATVTPIAIPAGTRLILNVTTVGSTVSGSAVVCDFVCDSSVTGAAATVGGFNRQDFNGTSMPSGWATYDNATSVPVTVGSGSLQVAFGATAGVNQDQFTQNAPKILTTVNYTGDFDLRTRIIAPLPVADIRTAGIYVDNGTSTNASGARWLFGYTNHYSGTAAHMFHSYSWWGGAAPANNGGPVPESVDTLYDTNGLFVRLTRTGTVFKYWTSTDGNTWTSRCTVDLTTSNFNVTRAGLIFLHSNSTAWTATTDWFSYS